MRRLLALIESLLAALRAQSAYSDVVVGPAQDSDLDPPLAGFEVITSGDVEIQTAAGSTVTLPAETGRIYPVAVARIESAGTSVPAGDIIGYVE